MYARTSRYQSLGILKARYRPTAHQGARVAQKRKGEAKAGPPHPTGFPKESPGASLRLNKISK